MRRVIVVGFTLIMLLTILGCAKTKVTRTDIQTDLSGRWNDTDAKLVAEEMIKDVLSRPWYSEFLKKNGREPVVIIGSIRNLTTEHLDTDIFIKDMERELINSGMVKFVASRDDRMEIREELQSQQDYSSLETAKKLAEETGADLILQGSIKIIVDSLKDVKAKFYQTDLQLISLQSTEKVWIGSKEIKKIVSKGAYKP